MILLFIQKTLLCFFPSLLFSSLFNSRDILCCCYHFCICHFHLVFSSQSFYLFILSRLFDNSFLKGRLNLFTSFEFNKVTVGEISSLKLATIGLKLRTLGRKRQMYQKLPSTAISCPQCSWNLLYLMRGLLPDLVLSVIKLFIIITIWWSSLFTKLCSFVLVLSSNSIYLLSPSLFLSLSLSLSFFLSISLSLSLSLFLSFSPSLFQPLIWTH